MPELLPDDVVAEACEQTGLDDFGPDGFREGLTVLCGSINDEAQLNDFGDAAVRGAVVNSLGNRLRVFDWIRRHPEIGDERIEAPIVVIGMFRAGTTFLSQLLDQDPRNRALLRWEASDSVPPPSHANFRSGPRVDAARLSNDTLEDLNPRMKAIHHEDAAGATECIAVMSQDFKSLSWEAITNVPAYRTAAGCSPPISARRTSTTARPCRSSRAAGFGVSGRSKARIMRSPSTR
jgi:Sulfotransferase family